MKINVIKWAVPALIIGSLLLTACGGKYPGFKEQNGMYYKIMPDANASSDRVADSGMTYQLRMSYGNPDTLLFDFTTTPGTPINMPYTKPMYKGDINEAFALLKAGDSAVFILQADSFFMNTMRMPEVPEAFKKDNALYFYVKMLNILTAEEMEAMRQKELAEFKTKAATDLQAFIQKNYPQAKAQDNGLYVIVEKKGKGKVVKKGEYANIDFAVYNLKGQEFYDSRKTKTPQDIEIGKRFDTEGFTQGLSQMRKGEEAVFIVPGSLAFGEQGRRGMLEPYEGIKYWVRVNSVQSKAKYEAAQKKKREAEKRALEAQKAKESKTIAKYIKDNKITVKPTESGLYFIEKAKGTGKQAVAGNKVKVHYRGTLLDGTPFDASYDRGEPFEFTLGARQVIAGWDEAIAMMKEGGKAEIILPSKIAYGARGGGAVIKPYSPLKFEVELIEVIDNAKPKE